VLLATNITSSDLGIINKIKRIGCFVDVDDVTCVTVRRTDWIPQINRVESKRIDSMASSSLHFISIHRTVVLRSTTVDCPVSVSLALPLQLRWQNSAGCTTVTLSTTSQRLSAITLPRTGVFQDEVVNFDHVVDVDPPPDFWDRSGRCRFILYLSTSGTSRDIRKGTNSSMDGTLFGLGSSRYHFISTYSKRGCGRQPQRQCSKSYVIAANSLWKRVFLCGRDLRQGNWNSVFVWHFYGSVLH
jgi:hypothetical protein